MPTCYDTGTLCGNNGVSGQIEMLSQQQHAMLARPAENGQKATLTITKEDMKYLLFFCGNACAIGVERHGVQLSIRRLTSVCGKC